jgi:arsenite methyltransferase
MSPGLDFNEQTARQLDVLYQTVDVIAQRIKTRRLLALKPGERVLDIGSGPGFLVSEMAEDVGKRGQVQGIDISPAMVAMAIARCAGKPSIQLQKAGATALPFKDASFDAVVSVQVFEYVDDLPKALSEILRVLKPGGRLLLIDSDMGSIVLNTAEPARMTRVLNAWNEHLTHPYLPRTLAKRLKTAGFALGKYGVIPLLNLKYGPDHFSYTMVKMVAEFVGGRQSVTEIEARAWADEQVTLAADDAYFYSMNRYYFLSSKPEG